jgi:hypothetical protein
MMARRRLQIIATGGDNAKVAEIDIQIEGAPQLVEGAYAAVIGEIFMSAGPWRDTLKGKPIGHISEQQTSRLRPEDAQS